MRTTITTTIGRITPIEAPPVIEAPPPRVSWKAKAGEAGNATEAAVGARAAIKAMGRRRRMASWYRPARSKPRHAGDDVEAAGDAGMAWGGNR